MTRRGLSVALAVVLVTQAVLYAVLLGHNERTITPKYGTGLFVSTAVLWLIAIGILSRLRLVARKAAVLVLGVGAVFSIVAMTHEPSTSDDDFRYIWDAKVQLAGVDPYRYAPWDERLAGLRAEPLFGPPGKYPYDIIAATTQINRPVVRTIYPPVAEGAFTAIRVLSFGGQGNHLPLQIAAALGALVVGLLLVRRGPPWRAALWTWCPVTIIEFANNAHIDWLGVLLGVLAFAAARGTLGRGLLVGAAIAVKLYPALVLPALMRRDWRVALVAVATVALVYVPHVIAVGTDVIGYLPGYLEENQYGSGQRLLLLGPVFGDTGGKIVGVAVLAAVALWAWLRGSREHPEHAAVLVVGIAFLVVTPGYGWYAGLLLALIALTGAVEWLPVVGAATLAYLVHSDHDSLIYTVALGATVVIALVRGARGGRWSLRSGPWTRPRSSSRTTAHLPSSPSTPRR